MKALEKFGNCYFQHFRWDLFQAQCGQKRGCDCGLRTNQDTVVLGYVALCLETYGGPRGVGVSYERGTPVRSSSSSLLSLQVLEGP